MNYKLHNRGENRYKDVLFLEDLWEGGGEEEEREWYQSRSNRREREYKKANP